MGMYSDFLNNATTLDINTPIDAADKSAYNELKRQYQRADRPYPSNVATRNEVQSLSANDHTGGTFTLAFTLESGETFTTAGIAYNANAATIEGAIDTAATAASIADWTNGDISVSGGAANANPVVFTFDGDSVAGTNPALIVNDGTSLTGGADDGTVTVTAKGQPNRTGLAVLIDLGIVTVDSLPDYQVAPVAGSFTGVSMEAYPQRPGKPVVDAVIEYIEKEEGVDYRDVIYSELGW